MGSWLSRCRRQEEVKTFRLWVTSTYMEDYGTLPVASSLSSIQDLIYKNTGLSKDLQLLLVKENGFDTAFRGGDQISRCFRYDIWRDEWTLSLRSYYKPTTNP